MQRPKKLTITAPTAASANNIAQSQTPGGAVNLTLNGSLVSGGVATNDIARRVVIHSVADDSGRTFTIYGTDRYGNVISEALAGATAGADATSLKDYKTVTRIAVDAATAGAITVGSSSTFSTQWVPMDFYRSQYAALQAFLSAGAVTFSIEETFANPNPDRKVDTSPDLYLPPVDHPDMSGLSASANGKTSPGCTAVRVKVTAFSSTLSMDLHITPADAES